MSIPYLNIELVVYARTNPCPFVSLARRVLQRENVPYQEVYIDQDKEAERLVLEWTGFLSVPTLIIARAGEQFPIEAPSPLPRGASPRGVDRGTMLTEPGEDQLVAWLRHHGLLNSTQVEASND